MNTSIWNATAGTPTASHRVPVDTSSSGGPTRYTVQQFADLTTSVGCSVNALGSIGTNTSINLALGGFVSATITGNLTFSFTNPAAGGTEFTLVLTNGGAHTITWPGSVTWAGATAPTLTASGVDVLRFTSGNGGTNWYGSHERDEVYQEVLVSATNIKTVNSASLLGSGNILIGNTKWIGAGELIPRVTSGAGIDGEELATNKINLDYLAFDTASAEYAQVSFAWPGAYTTFTATFHWTAASGSGTVTWTAAARCYADDDALDQAQGTAQSVTDTLLAANDAHKSSATSAVTPGGTVASGNLCVVQIARDIADTLAVDARLIGVMLEFA